MICRHAWLRTVFFLLLVALVLPCGVRGATNAGAARRGLDRAGRRNSEGHVFSPLRSPVRAFCCCINATASAKSGTILPNDSLPRGSTY